MIFDIEITGIVVAILIGVLVPVTPVLVFVCVGWRVKKNEIMDGLSKEAKQKYFEMFSLSSLKGRSARELDFGDFYSLWYGRRFYILPVALLVLVLGFASTVVVFTALHHFPAFTDRHEPYDLPSAAMAALAGAYMWVSSDFISRARRLDFSPSDVQWGVLRLVVCVPLGYAFASLASDAVAPTIAFALGAFPLGALIDLLQQALFVLIRRRPDSPTANDTVLQLQGIDDTIAKRLAAEDITTVAQVAYCDPIRIVMRSNLTFSFVIDCMNQALAWLYFEKQMATLRPLGLRGAAEIAMLVDGLRSADEHARTTALATLSDVVDAIRPPHTTQTMSWTFEQIAKDPYTVFLREVWVSPFDRPST